MRKRGGSGMEEERTCPIEGGEETTRGRFKSPRKKKERKKVHNLTKKKKKKKNPSPFRTPYLTVERETTSSSYFVKKRVLSIL